LTLDEAELDQPKLKNMGGSKSDDWNHALVNQAMSSLWLAKDKEEQLRQWSAVAWGLKGIAPKDEVEAMLAAQLIATHNSAMECYRRAMHSEQSFEGRQMNLKFASKLSNSHVALVDALKRYRGRGKQEIIVKHVRVEDEVQRVPATVPPVPRLGGGECEIFEEQPHAKQNGHAH